MKCNRKALEAAANAFHVAAATLFDLVDGRTPATPENIKHAIHRARDARDEAMRNLDRILEETDE